MTRKKLTRVVTYGAFGILSGLSFVMPHHLSPDYALAAPCPAIMVPASTETATPTSPAVRADTGTLALAGVRAEASLSH